MAVPLSVTANPTATSGASAQGSEINAPFTFNNNSTSLLQYVMVGLIVVALIMAMRR